MNAKTAIVTGASKGIGLAIALKLINKGWNVIGIARQFISDLPKGFIPYKLDLANIKELPKALKQLKKEHPTIDSIICNAGKGSFGSLEELSFADIHSLIDLNFLSHVYLIKMFLPELKKQNNGSVIFIGSEAALQGKRMGSIYCASKFALRGFAQALRDECSTSNVRITIINPGMVQTDFFKDLKFCPGESSLEHLLPEDVAEAVDLVLNAREGAVFDEINLSPQKKRIRFATSLPKEDYGILMNSQT